MVRQAGGILHMALLESTRRCSTTDADPSLIRAELRPPSEAVISSLYPPPVEQPYNDDGDSEEFGRSAAEPHRGTRRRHFCRCDDDPRS